MQIKLPEHFRNAGEITDPNAALDPRSDGFSETRVEIDLSSTRFMRPPALLWALTYPLLANRRSHVLVRFPSQPGVCHWLASLGLPDLLRAHGVELVGNIPAMEPDRGVVLRLTRFASASDAESVTEQAVASLSESRLGTSNVRPLVGQIFSELALNAVQHAKSPIAAYGYVQYYEFEEGPRFVCGVADAGIGILDSLRRNTAFSYLRSDPAAIDAALEPRVSGTGLPNRGIGLAWVRDEMGNEGRRMVIHSVKGAILLEGANAARARFNRLFPGTSACIWIPA